MKRIESKRACPIWRRSWRRDHFFKHRLQPNFFFQGSIVYSGTYQRCRIGERQTTTGRRTKARGPCEWRFRWDDESRSVGLRRLSLPVRRSYPIEYTTQSPDFPAFATPLAIVVTLSLSSLPLSHHKPFPSVLYEQESSLAHRTHQRSLIKISILIVRRLPSRADVLAGVRFHAHDARCRSSARTNPYISLVNVVSNDVPLLSARFGSPAGTFSLI